MWTLFLDDERFPAKDAPGIVICRTSAEALREISLRGCPIEMNLDHDLGPGDDAQIFAAGIIEMALDGDLAFPEGFSFSVHSMNPVGGKLLASKIDAIVVEMRRRKEADACPQP